MKFLEKYQGTIAFFIIAALAMLLMDDNMSIIMLLIAVGFLNVINAVEKNGSGRGGTS